MGTRISLLVSLCLVCHAGQAQRIAAGQSSAFAICADSTVNAWGSNVFGVLGNNSLVQSWNPVGVLGLQGVTAVSSGWEGISLALTSSGRVWAWGYNLYGQFGNGSTTNSLVPTEIPSLQNVVAISTGGLHSLFLLADGTVSSCGNNEYGQLGDGSLANALTPVPVAGLTDVVAIAAVNWYSLALRSDGTVWSWGRNTSSGLLGDGTTIDHSLPAQVAGLSGVIAISAAQTHAMALCSDGSVWAWGSNFYGFLGDGTQLARIVPTAVLIPNTAIAIAAGYDFSAILLNNGTVWTCGYNFAGALGIGTNADSHIPVQAAVPTGITAIAAGNSFCLALHADGSLWSWGHNGFGQLGNGTNQDTNLPAPVIQLCTLGGTNIMEDVSSAEFSVAPNPAHDRIRIAVPAQAFLLRIMDVQGQEVLARAVETGHDEVDLQAFPVGLYLLQARTADGRSWSKRVVKE